MQFLVILKIWRIDLLHWCRRLAAKLFSSQRRDTCHLCGLDDGSASSCEWCGEPICEDHGVLVIEHSPDDSHIEDMTVCIKCTEDNDATGDVVSYGSPDHCMVQDRWYWIWLCNRRAESLTGSQIHNISSAAWEINTNQGADLIFSNSWLGALEKFSGEVFEGQRMARDFIKEQGISVHYKPYLDLVGRGTPLSLGSLNSYVRDLCGSYSDKPGAGHYCATTDLKPMRKLMTLGYARYLGKFGGLSFFGPTERALEAAHKEMPKFRFEVNGNE